MLKGTMRKFVFYSQRAILLPLFVLGCIDVFAQRADFEYQTELCECKAQFDSVKYSRRQLENTYKYLYNEAISYIATDATSEEVHTLPEKIINDLKTECAEKMEILRKSDFVGNSFWLDQRDKIMDYVQKTCRLREYTALAFANPKVLLEYDLVDSTCVYFRDALIAGGEELLQAWAELNEMQKRQNADPQGVQLRYEREYYSAERMQHARDEVMIFGWWNSANRLLPHLNTDRHYDEFEKLFTSVNCDCDEP